MFLLATVEPAVVATFQNPGNAEAQATLKALLKVVESKLGMPYALGSQLTAVDILVHGSFGFMANLGLLDDLPKAKAYYERHKNTIPAG